MPSQPVIRRIAWSLSVAGLALLSATLLVAGFVEGPFPGMTGGFREPTCRFCHFDKRLNDPAGSLIVSGIPKSYNAARQYAITIILTRPAMARGGFQLSARFAAGARRGEQAGVLKPTDGRVQIVEAPDGKVKYAQHTPQGTVAAPNGALQWVVEWTAPDPPGAAVVFNVAGNAANNDTSPLGDFIYVREARSTVGQGGVPGPRSRPERWR